MKRPELSLRSHWLKAWPGKASRIEPSIGSTPGFPDIWACHKGSAGLIEFKALDEEAHVTLEPSQRLWLIENIPHYDRVLIVTLSEQGCYLLPAPPLVHKGMPLRFPGIGPTFLPWTALVSKHGRSTLARYTERGWEGKL
jgi:hypothetical protein